MIVQAYAGISHGGKAAWPMLWQLLFGLFLPLLGLLLGLLLLRLLLLRLLLLLLLLQVQEPRALQLSGQWRKPWLASWLLL